MLVYFLLASIASQKRRIVGLASLEEFADFILKLSITSQLISIRNSLSELPSVVG